jgi:hypothetical protein
LVQHAINKAAKETHNSPQLIIAEATATTSTVTAAHLPNPESLKRNIRRLRQEDGPAAQMPANLRELVSCPRKSTSKKQRRSIFTS